MVRTTFPRLHSRSQQRRRHRMSTMPCQNWMVSETRKEDKSLFLLSIVFIFLYSFFKYRVCLSAHFLLFFFLFQGNVCKFLQFFFISHPFIGLSILLFHPSNSLSSSEPVSVVIGREAGYILHRSRGCLGAIHYLTHIYYNVTKEGQNFALFLPEEKTDSSPN